MAMFRGVKLQVVHSVKRTTDVVRKTVLMV
jgi:hypothetical protein